jgi:hypothetical protein
MTDCLQASDDMAYCGESYTGECVPASVGTRGFSVLLLFLQIVQELSEHEHPEGADVGVHSASLGHFGTILGSIQRVIRS